MPVVGAAGQWIQVSCELPKFWTDVILQGRGDADQWVKNIKVSWTLNGKLWEKVDEDKVFEANSDRNQNVRIRFSGSVYARALRIYPQSFNGAIALRFDAIYLEVE
jgi:hypothetical protein